jgi:hypothetical protein
MKRAIRIGGLTAASVGAWFGLAQPIRHWYLHWGATPTELKRTMPLDDRVAQPNLDSTMAITIDAPPEDIWPWIVQLGEPPRAGYYSYTFIERMVGLDVKNAGRLLPEFQSLEVGQAIDQKGTMVVQAVEPEKLLVLGPPEQTPELQATWAMVLSPIDGHHTRLVMRVRGAWSYRNMLRATPPYTWPFYLLVEPGAFLMERKMLQEIKRLAESATR